jgi:methionyl-tRNA formyltransferase
MRVIFAGTPEFARSALAALHAAGHDIVGVLTPVSYTHLRAHETN